MGKVDLDNQSVAYFDDDRVDEPGFYLLEGKVTKSMVKVQDGGEIEMRTEIDPETDEEFQVPVLDTRSRLVHTSVPRVVKEIEVEHESDMTPGDRVYPSPDGKGFVTEDPEGSEG